MEKPKVKLIRCPKCEQETPLKAEHVFDDSFRPVGMRKYCSFCRFEFMDDSIPWVEEKKNPLFDPTLERKICQYCEHYVVNPFTQKCTVWNKVVTATDGCDQFKRKVILQLS